MRKIMQLVRRHYDVLSYLFFGGLTTAVNYLVYFPCYHYFALPAGISNMIAWVVAVAFAFVTNKPFVFKSRDWSPGTMLGELWKFVSCRFGSGALETAVLFLTVDQLGWSGTWMKLLTGVFVVVFNYFCSKLLIFRKKA